MRLKPGMTVLEAKSRLNRAQRDALNAVISARESEQSSADDSKVKIREALNKGVPVVVISAEIGISDKRIYQIREEAKRLSDSS